MPTKAELEEIIDDKNNRISELDQLLVNTIYKTKRLEDSIEQARELIRVRDALVKEIEGIVESDYASPQQKVDTVSLLLFAFKTGTF